ncbi:hypothetical protein EDD18DRAFT_1161097 [Armillaria luteobubalina]|uniref:Uncharacterized protein n=1 Tax=Armillaria luteobubalina TaxID=153913 RepID=A0AA39UTX1_9AGAR|nr:hypothetical protein EDD18DRAFT_1161097 [Armillaria luteobubalina]
MRRVFAALLQNIFLSFRLGRCQKLYVYRPTTIHLDVHLEIYSNSTILIGPGSMPKFGGPYFGVGGSGIGT